jgi:hypothetical protein
VVIQSGMRVPPGAGAAAPAERLPGRVMLGQCSPARKQCDVMDGDLGSHLSRKLSAGHPRRRRGTRLPLPLKARAAQRIKVGGRGRSRVHTERPLPPILIRFAAQALKGRESSLPTASCSLLAWRSNLPRAYSRGDCFATLATTRVRGRRGRACQPHTAAAALPGPNHLIAPQSGPQPKAHGCCRDGHALQSRCTLGRQTSRVGR